MLGAKSCIIKAISTTTIYTFELNMPVACVSLLKVFKTFLNSCVQKKSKQLRKNKLTLKRSDIEDLFGNRKKNITTDCICKNGLDFYQTFCK